MAVVAGLSVTASPPADATVTTGATAAQLAMAISADESLVTGASFVTEAAPQAAGVSDDIVAGFPRDGQTFGVLSSGDASRLTLPNDSGSSGDDLGGVTYRGALDVTILQLDLTVPDTANCLSFDFKFLSEEFPEFVGSQYNDAFLGELVAETDESTWTTSAGNISAPDNFATDPGGNPISINGAGVTSMSAGAAAGTTYDGATPLLSATTPITPGNHRLFLSIFDQGDPSYDSAVLADNLHAFAVQNIEDCHSGVTAAPRLTTSINAPTVACPGDPIGDAVTVTVDNRETEQTSGSVTLAIQPENNNSESEPTVIDTVQEVAIPPGQTTTVHFNPGALFPDVGSQRATLLATTSFTNDLASAAIALVCGVSSVTGLSVQTSSATTPAGATDLPLDAVSPESITFGATGSEDQTAAELPGRGLPGRGLPGRGLPGRGLPGRGLPGRGLLGELPQFVLDQLHLSDIPVYNGWERFLPPGVLPNQITVGEFLQLPETGDSLFVDDLDLAHSPLRGLTAAAIATAPKTLSEIGVCPTVINDGRCLQSLLELELLGKAPVIPWSTLSFANMDLDGSVLFLMPIGDITKENTPAAGTDTTGMATYGDLIHSVNHGVLAASRLGDWLMGVLPDLEYWPLAALSPERAPLLAPLGEPLTQTVSFTSNGPAPLVDPTVTVHLAQGFLFDGMTGEQQGPSVGTGGTLTWQLNEIVPVGATVTFSYRVMPGITLGTFGTGLNVAAFDQFGPVGNQLADASPVTVVDNEIASPNDDSATSPVVQPRVRKLGFISSATDVDYFRIPVPKTDDCDMSDTATGAVGEGCRVQISLDLLGDDADLDMQVFGPEVDSTVSGAPGRGLPGRGLAVDDTPFVYGQTIEAPPETLNDSPVAGLPGRGLPGRGLPGRGLSTARGTSNEYTEVVTLPSDADGYYTVQIYGYNGATSQHAYGLSVSVQLPTPLPECRTVVPQPTTGLPAAPTVPAGTKTLILTDQSRMGAHYGAPAAAQYMDELATFGARSEVRGFIYPIDSDPAVVSALTAWDASSCNVTAENQAVAAIANRIIAIRNAVPSIDSVVLVGSSEIFPMANVPDNSSIVNEAEYVGALHDAASYPATTSAASRNFRTDDAYATDEVIDSNGHNIFVPKWAVSRLVETPAQIEATTKAYLDSNGQAANPKALVTGYDFITDGSQAVADALQPAGQVDRLICDQWTAGDLTGPVMSGCPGVSGSAGGHSVYALNSHASHQVIFPPQGDDGFTIANAGSLTGAKIVFGMGCHFGANVPFEGDWADTLANQASVVIGNSGYGYGETNGVGYSESLLQRFAKDLAAGVPAGQAMVDAKRGYYLEQMGAYDPISEKALQELVVYGLGQFHLSVPAQQAQAAAAAETLSAAAAPIAGSTAALTVDAATGMLVRPFDSGQLSFTDHTGPNGTYITVGPNGDVLNLNNHPIIPQQGYTVPLDPRQPGQKPLGLFVTGFTAPVPDHNFDPVFAKAEYSEASTPEQQATGAFPTAPGTITSLGGDNRLLLWPGKFVSTGTDASNHVIGDMQRRSNVRGTLYFGSDVIAPPNITNVEATRIDAGHVSYVVRVDGDSHPVTRVAVLAGGSVFVDLQPTDASHGVWTGVMATADDHLDTLVQAVSAGGVGYWADKGDTLAPTPLAPVDGALAVSVIAPRPPVNGWYRDPVNVTVTSPAGAIVEYQVDGGAWTPYTGPIPIATSGSHLVKARSGTLNVAASVRVDLTGPVITSALDGAVLAVNSTPPKPWFTCTDAGDGVASCQGPSKLNTARTGSHSFTVTATDNGGRTSTRTITYSVYDGLPAQGSKIQALTAGSSRNYKFKLYGPTGAEITNPAGMTMTWVTINCTTSADVYPDPLPQKPIQAGTPTTPATIAYTLGFFKIEVKTEKPWKGSCRKFVITFPGGSTFEDRLKFT